MKLLTILLVSCLGVLEACSHNNVPVKFYRLSADLNSVDTGKSQAMQPESIKKISVNEGSVIGLGPVKIPDYLNRLQIVTAQSENEYVLSEEHRWAERLDQNILLALYKTLPQYVKIDRMVRYPWSQRQVIDYQVSIDIVEFNVNQLGRSRLIAQWTVKHKDEVILDKRSDFQVSTSTTDYALMVKAQSECLSLLTKEISDALNGLRGGSNEK